MLKTKLQTKLKLQNQNYKKWLGVLNIKNWDLFDSCDFEIGIFNVKPQKGFTLIEMLISLGIMAILAAATLSTITQSRDHVRLNQSAGEVAALFREAQARALGVTGAVEGGVVQAFPGYGVFVSKGIASSENRFVLFPDLDNDGKVTLGASFTTAEIHPGRLLGEFYLPAGIVISEINDGQSNRHQVFSVGYNRPDPSVTFQVSEEVNLLSLRNAGTNIMTVCISAPRDNIYKVISIWKTGQVAVSETQDDCIF